MAQTRQDPALHHLDGDLDLGLVARLAHACRHDGGAVVGRHLLVGAVDPRLVATCGSDAGLEIVAVMCRPLLCAGPPASL